MATQWTKKAVLCYDCNISFKKIIYVCENGHSICQECYHEDCIKNSVCGFCKRSVKFSRNYQLEYILPEAKKVYSTKINIDKWISKYVYQMTYEKQHINQCLLRMKSCVYHVLGCKKKVSPFHKLDHEAVCERRIISRDIKSQNNGLIKNEVNKQTILSADEPKKERRDIACSYKKYGCQVKFERQTVYEHELECDHKRGG